MLLLFCEKDLVKKYHYKNTKCLMRHFVEHLMVTLTPDRNDEMARLRASCVPCVHTARVRVISIFKGQLGDAAARGVVCTDSVTVALSSGGVDRKAKLQGHGLPGVVLGCTTS